MQLQAPYSTDHTQRACRKSWNVAAKDTIIHQVNMQLRAPYSTDHTQRACQKSRSVAAEWHDIITITYHYHYIYLTDLHSGTRLTVSHSGTQLTVSHSGIHLYTRLFYYYYVLFIPCINVLYVSLLYSLLYFVCFIYYVWYVCNCVQKVMFVYDVRHKKLSVQTE